MSFQKVEMFYDSYLSCFRDYFGFDTRYSVFRYRDGDVSVYFDADEIDALSPYLKERFTDSYFIQECVRSIPDDTRKVYDAHIEFANSIPQDCSRLDYSELNEWVEKMYAADEKITLYYWVYFTTVEDAMLGAVGDALKNNGISNNEADKIILELSEPNEMVPLDSERLSLLNVALADTSERETMLEKHWEEHRYLSVFDMHYEPLTLDHIREKLEALLAERSTDALSAERTEIEAKYANRARQQRQILKRFEEGSDIWVLLDMIRQYGYFKDMKPYYRDKTSLAVQPLFQEIARRFDVSLDVILHMTKDELRASLQGGRLSVSEAMLEKRIADSLIICEDGVKTIVTDPDFLSEADRCLEGEREETITGLVAFRGRGRGRSRVILSSHDFGKFRKGDVLVASATRPEFVPLMKQAVAVVTDEGGMLSHAAIVSRELKIPCIVGTKNATRVLNDGDEVEVDAETGAVRIAERSETNRRLAGKQED
jgi:phosphohistidine swiveling domain-containing protein